MPHGAVHRGGGVRTLAPGTPGTPSLRAMDERRPRMLEVRLSPRNALAILLVLGGAFFALWVVQHLIHTLIWVCLAIVLACALAPMVGALERRARLPRPFAIAVAYLVLVGAVVGLGILLIPRLIAGVRELADAVPDYVDRLSHTRAWQRLGGGDELGDRLIDWAGDLSQRIGPDNAINLLGWLSGLLFGLITVLVLSVGFLVYAGAIRDGVLARVPSAHRARVATLAGEMARVVGGYVAGMTVIGAAAALSAWLVLSLLGLPAALALSVWVGVCVLVPVVGALVGAIPAVIVAAMDDWKVAVGVVVFFVCYQQLENHVLQPLIMRRAVNLNPLLVLITVIAGIELAGAVGAVLAIPLAGVVQVLIRDLTTHGIPRADGGVTTLTEAVVGRDRAREAADDEPPDASSAQP